MSAVLLAAAAAASVAAVVLAVVAAAARAAFATAWLGGEPGGVSSPATSFTEMTSPRRRPDPWADAPFC